MILSESCDPEGPNPSQSRHLFGIAWAVESTWAVSFWGSFSSPTLEIEPGGVESRVEGAGRQRGGEVSEYLDPAEPKASTFPFFVFVLLF